MQGPTAKVPFLAVEAPSPGQGGDTALPWASGRKVPYSLPGSSRVLLCLDHFPSSCLLLESSLTSFSKSSPSTVVIPAKGPGSGREVSFSRRQATSSPSMSFVWLLVFPPVKPSGACEHLAWCWHPVGSGHAGHGPVLDCELASAEAEVTAFLWTHWPLFSWNVSPSLSLCFLSQITSNICLLQWPVSSQKP